MLQLQPPLSPEAPLAASGLVVGPSGRLPASGVRAASGVGAASGGVTH